MHLHRNNMINITAGISVMIFLGTILLCAYLRRGRQRPEEEPQMEKNEVYNLEDDYYDEHETRIEDMNEYYE